MQGWFCAESVTFPQLPIHARLSFFTTFEPHWMRHARISFSFVKRALKLVFRQSSQRHRACRPAGCHIKYCTVFLYLALKYFSYFRLFRLFPNYSQTIPKLFPKSARQPKVHHARVRQESRCTNARPERVQMFKSDSEYFSIIAFSSSRGTKSPIVR